MRRLGLDVNDLRQEAELIESLLPKLMRKLFRPVMDDTIGELPLAQLRVVRALEVSPHTVSELAEEFRMSLSSASQLVHRLVDAGLVHVDCESVDRRIRTVKLTALGSKLMRHRRETRIQLAENALAGLSPVERATLLSSLGRLLAECESVGAEPSESLAQIAELEHGA